MRNLIASLLLATLFYHVNVSAAEQALLTKPLTSEHFRVTLRNQTDTLSINRFQHWIIHLEDFSGTIIDDAKITLTGGMPEHNHGLPTKPQVTEYMGEGNYLLEGLKFHMAGRWQLDFTISAQGHRDQLSFSLEI